MPPQPGAEEPRGSPHPIAVTAAKALHVVGGVAQVWGDDTAEGEPGPGPTSMEHQYRGKAPSQRHNEANGPRCPPCGVAVSCWSAAPLGSNDGI